MFSHAGGLLCLWLSGMPWFYALPLSLAILASLRHTLRRYAGLQHPRSVVALHFSEDKATLAQRDGASLDYDLHSASAIGVALFVLCLKDTQGRVRRELLHADMMSADSSRRLRTALVLRGG